MPPNFPTLLSYKLTKFQVDYARAHDVMWQMCPGKDHESFSATNALLDDMRRISDDLAADVISAWDALLDELMVARGIPPAKIPARLRALQQADAAIHSLVTDTWDRLISKVNDVRNEYQHNDFWRNAFGVGQGNGPFMMDLIAEVKGHRVYVLRDTRRAAHAIAALHASAALTSNIPALANPCPDCYGDQFIGPPLDWGQLGA